MSSPLWGNYLKRRLAQVGDLNDCLYEGEYLYGATTSNIPNAGYGLCYVHSTNMPESAGTGWVIQIAYSTVGQIYTRRKINSGGNWTNWWIVGETPQSASVTKDSAVTTGTIDKNVVMKKNGWATASGRIYNMSNQASYGTFFNIPSGYRPGGTGAYGMAYAILGNNTNVLLHASIESNGAVIIGYSQSDTYKQVGFTATYPYEQ